MKRVALALLLVTTPAMAQDKPVESVTVYGRSLAGVWHGGLLDLRFVSNFFFVSTTKFLGVADGFCRIGPRKDALAMFCLQADGPGATVTADGDHLHVDWGTMLHSVAVDGELVSAGHFRGHFQVKSWGIAHDYPAVSDAARVAPDPAGPDTAGKAALLRRILDEGLAGVPQDADALKKNDSTLGLPKLGAIQSVAYLGQETKWDEPPPPWSKLDFAHLSVDQLPHRPDFFSVYLVSFAEGERLCGLHQRPDGVLDAFRCA